MSDKGGLTVWMTGLPAAGKTTLGTALAERLSAAGRDVHVLDGDELRRGLSSDLDMSPAGRAENVRRAGEIAALLAGQGAVAIVGLVSPYRAGRDAVRRRHEHAEIPFLEVWVATRADECARRDVTGLYRRAAAGDLPGLTGYDGVYEQPLNAESVVLPTPAADGVDPLLALVLERLE